MAANAATKLDPRSGTDDALAPLDAEGVRRSLRAAELPVASPTLAKRLDPGRFSALDAAATAAAVLDEPAALLALYAEAQRRRLPATADLVALITGLGAEGMCAVADLLRRRAILSTTDRAPLARGYRHALATAQLARRLAPAAGVDPMLAAAAALLHDVGRLALLAGDLAPRVQATYEKAASAPVGVAYVEQSVLGVTHREAGYEYAGRFHVPEAVAGITRAHECRDAERRRLSNDAARLAALVQLCDTLAKSHGYGGCDAEELGPVPRELAALGNEERAVREALAGVDAAIAQHWLTPPASPADTPLRGVTVLAASTSTATWSAAAAPLARAGAEVQPLARPGAAAGRRVVLLDGTDAPLRDVARTLAGLALLVPGAPRLVLADRAADPESRIAAIAPDASVLTTPLRAATLVKRVHHLANRKP